MENPTNFLMYQTDYEETKISVRLEDETVWMVQKAIAETYQKSIKTINGFCKVIRESI